MLQWMTSAHTKCWSTFCALCLYPKQKINRSYWKFWVLTLCQRTTLYWSMSACCKWRCPSCYVLAWYYYLEDKSTVFNWLCNLLNFRSLVVSQLSIWANMKYFIKEFCWSYSLIHINIMITVLCNNNNKPIIFTAAADQNHFNLVVELFDLWHLYLHR